MTSLDPLCGSCDVLPHRVAGSFPHGLTTLKLHITPSLTHESLNFYNPPCALSPTFYLPELSYSLLHLRPILRISLWSTSMLTASSSSGPVVA